MRPQPRQKIDTETLGPLLRIQSDSPLSLQEQVRAGIIRAIQTETVKPGTKLPSSRKLADHLGLSRNTVMLAYQRMLAEGHLESRERSGIYVPRASVGPRLAVVETEAAPVEAAVAPRVRLRERREAHQGFQCPPDWQRYRYPFIEGRYDKSLFPTAEWREASRLALAASEVEQWSLDNGEADDEALIEEIRTKLLPRRGITARPDELLITVGEQQALFLAAELFAAPGVRAGVENPGLPEMRTLLERRGAKLVGLEVDDEGVVVGEDAGHCDLICVSPSRQRPTAVTLSQSRREELMQLARARGTVIIEDDFECEMSNLDAPLPALRAMEGGERVIYVASLSKVLAPGVRLGFMVAPAPVIAAARRLRDLTTRRPSPNNQRAAAFFLSLGHYDAMLRRLVGICEERRIALRDALNHYRPMSIAVAPARGGTSYWVRGPEGLDATRLVEMARARGILIEPADPYFVDPDARSSMFRLGVTSLPAGRIREGVAELSEAIKQLAEAPVENAQPCLPGGEIKQRLQGATLLYKTVYGEPCTIELHADGRMSGLAGYAHEDRDKGRWWIDGDHWYRQWDRWAYAEAVGFRVAIDGERLSWLNDDGERVDGAVVLNPESETGPTESN